MRLTLLRENSQKRGQRYCTITVPWALRLLKSLNAQFVDALSHVKDKDD